jgi:hypothetical protein
MKTQGKVLIAKWEHITPKELDLLGQEGRTGVINGDAKLILVDLY